MSGRIAANNGPATKSDFARLQSRVDSILSRLSDLSSDVRTIKRASDTEAPRSSNTSPVVPSRRKGSITSWLSFKSSQRSPKIPGPETGLKFVCKHCGKSDAGNSDPMKNIYNKQADEEAHDRLRNEFSQFQADVTRDIKSLQTAVKEVKEHNENLEKLIRESTTRLQDSVEKMSLQLLANYGSVNQQSIQKQARNSEHGNWHHRKLEQ